jgi:hypothetical protein
LICESKRRHDHADKITRKRIEAFAGQVQPFDGVQATLDRLRDQARTIDRRRLHMLGDRFLR